jgi:peroxiredoxin
VVLFPLAVFRWAGLDPPRYPQLWQGVGMVVGVYGVGYLVAAGDPLRHWPIVLVGLLGKVLGPIGFLGAVLAGELPWALGWMIVANDLIWWLPFALILAAAYRFHNPAPSWSSEGERQETRDAIKTFRSSNGHTLHEFSLRQPVLVVFLRHAGCTFCREAMADLGRQRHEIEEAGVRLALVHMSPDDYAARVFARYGLDDAERYSDPDRALYRSFGLRKGNLWQLFGPKVLLRGFKACILDGHGVGKLKGNGLQMPGVFMLFHGNVVAAYRHKTAADRPDYAMLACDLTPIQQREVLRHQTLGVVDRT